MTLADEDTNSIPTDNANRAIQGNVAMHVTLPGSTLLYHVSLVLGCQDDQQINPNINNKDHLVGQLTSCLVAN